MKFYQLVKKVNGKWAALTPVEPEEEPTPETSDEELVKVMKERPTHKGVNDD